MSKRNAKPESVKERAEGKLASSLLPSAGLDLNKPILLHSSGPGLPQPEIRGVQRKRQREGTSDQGRQALGEWGQV